MPEREIGIVRWYDSNEGIGYITRKQGDDIYVHYSAIQCNSENCNVNEGDAVEFTVRRGSKGLQAQDVIVLR